MLTTSCSPAAVCFCHIWGQASLLDSGQAGLSRTKASSVTHGGFFFVLLELAPSPEENPWNGDLVLGSLPLSERRKAGSLCRESPCPPGPLLSPLNLSLEPFVHAVPLHPCSHVSPPTS